MKGWFKDSYRHHLAARGIPTTHHRYFQSKLVEAGYFRLGGEDAEDMTSQLQDPEVSAELARLGLAPGQAKPSERAQRISGASSLQKAIRRAVLEDRPIFETLGDVESGNWQAAVELLKMRTASGGGYLTPNERDALRAKLAQYAVASQELGQSVPASLESVLPLDTRERLKAMRTERRLGRVELDWEGTLKRINAKNISMSERDALVAKLAEYAVKRADAGLEIPPQMYSVLPPDTQKRIKSLQTLRARELESPFVSLLREKGAQAAVGLARGVASAPGTVAGSAVEAEAAGFRALGVGEKLTAEKEFKGPLAQEDDLEASPFFDKDVNYFIGNGPSPLSTFFSQPSLLGTEEGEKQPTFQEVVQRKVDSLSANKSKIAEVDLKSYEKGMEAFQKGNREKLVENIAELQSQEAKLKDRWDLLAQTRAQLMSPENHESLFDEKQGMWSFLGGQGGGRLADQTEKLSDVRGEILKSGNEVHARRSMLEYALKRLDSTVPPDTSAPRGRVDVLDERSSRMRGKMDMDIDNPLSVGKIDNPLGPTKIRNPLDPLGIRNPVV